MSSMNLDDIDRLDRAIADGRVTFIDGSHEVRPGLTLHLAADSHTFGSQWIEVASPEGPYVVASDSARCRVARSIICVKALPASGVNRRKSTSDWRPIFANARGANQRSWRTCRRRASRPLRSRE